MPMHFWVRSSFTLLYRNATSYGIRVCTYWWPDLALFSNHFSTFVTEKGSQPDLTTLWALGLTPSRGLSKYERPNTGLQKRVPTFEISFLLHFRLQGSEQRLQATEYTPTTLGPEYEYEYVYEYVYEDDYEHGGKGSSERGKSKTEKLNNQVLDGQNTKKDPYMWKKRGWSECSVTCGEGMIVVLQPLFLLYPHYLGHPISRVHFLAEEFWSFFSKHKTVKDIYCQYRQFLLIQFSITHYFLFACLPQNWFFNTF